MAADTATVAPMVAGTVAGMVVAGMVAAGMVVAGMAVAGMAVSGAGHIGAGAGRIGAGAGHIIGTTLITGMGITLTDTTTCRRITRRRPRLRNKPRQLGTIVPIRAVITPMSDLATAPGNRCPPCRQRRCPAPGLLVLESTQSGRHAENSSADMVGRVMK